MASRFATTAAILHAVAKAPRKPDPEVVKTTVELPAELWRSAKIRAMDDRIYLRTVLIRALEAFLDLPGESPSRKTRG